MCPDLRDKLIKESGGEEKVNLSEIIRDRLERRPADHKEIRELLYSLKIEISRIGTNINQITKSHNSGLYRSEDKQELEKAMLQLNILLRDIEQILYREI